MSNNSLILPNYPICWCVVFIIVSVILCTSVVSLVVSIFSIWFYFSFCSQSDEQLVGIVSFWKKTTHVIYQVLFSSSCFIGLCPSRTFMPNIASFKIFEFYIVFFVIKDITMDKDEEQQKDMVWRERSRVPMSCQSEALSETSCVPLTWSSLSYLQMQTFIAINVPLTTVFPLSHRL